MDEAFLRRRIVPEWWDDADPECASPAARAMVEFAISRFFGIPIADLRDPAVPLRLPPIEARIVVRTPSRRRRT